MEKTDQPHHQDQRQVLLEWETPEFIPIPRGKTWYLVAGLLVLALVIYGLFSGNLTMALVFILAAVLFLFIERREPRMVKVVIMDMGILYNKRFYPYHHINAFWLVYHPPYVRLLYIRLRTGRSFELIKIELNHQNPQQLRTLLLKEIPEIEGAGEPPTDLIARILRLQ